MEERFRFIEEWNSEDWSMAELCRWFGVTRKTGYKWLERYEAGGWEGLQDLSRAPHHQPNAVPEETEDRVLAVRELISTPSPASNIASSPGAGKSADTARISADSMSPCFKC